MSGHSMSESEAERADDRDDRDEHGDSDREDEREIEQVIERGETPIPWEKAREELLDEARGVARDLEATGAHVFVGEPIPRLEDADVVLCGTTDIRGLELLGVDHARGPDRQLIAIGDSYTKRLEDMSDAERALFDEPFDRAENDRRIRHLLRTLADSLEDARPEVDRTERMIQEAAQRVATASALGYLEAAEAIRGLVRSFEAMGYAVASIMTFGDRVHINAPPPAPRPTLSTPAFLALGMSAHILRSGSVTAQLHGEAQTHAIDAIQQFGIVAAETFNIPPQRRKISRGHEVNPYATGRRRVRGARDDSHGIRGSQCAGMHRHGARFFAASPRGRQ